MRLYFSLNIFERRGAIQVDEPIILVIEEEEEIRELVKCSLSAAPQRIEWVGSWQEAREYIQKHDVVLIICDEVLVLLEDLSFHRTMEKFGYKGALIFLSKMMDFHPELSLGFSVGRFRVLPRGVSAEELRRHAGELLYGPTKTEQSMMKSRIKGFEETEGIDVSGEHIPELCRLVRSLLSLLFCAYQTKQPSDLQEVYRGYEALCEHINKYSLSFVLPALSSFGTRLELLMRQEVDAEEGWSRLIRLFRGLLLQLRRHKAHQPSQQTTSTLCSELGVRELKILLVEDDEIDALFISSLFNEESIGAYTLIHASTIEEALESVEEGVPTVCISDFHLDQDTGFQLQTQLIERGYSFPMILLTGEGSYTLDLDAMHRGYAGYIDKAHLTETLLLQTLRYVMRQQQSREEVGALAGRDALTSLYSLGGFLALSEAALNVVKNESTYIAMYLIDVQNFQDVNERYGYVFGDRVLLALAHRLRQMAEPSDIIGRVGGDLFAVLRVGCRDLDDSARAVSSFAAQLGAELELEGETLALQLHIGVAFAPIHAQDADTLYFVALDAVQYARDDPNADVHVLL
ncbi:MAG: hypothetical protein CL932_01495 [Deltaproteobacteria bacterium]|nr:hypothetical protein [Deltaproteobacteria bacterium]